MTGAAQSVITSFQLQALQSAEVKATFIASLTREKTTEGGFDGMACSTALQKLVELDPDNSEVASILARVEKAEIVSDAALGEVLDCLLHARGNSLDVNSSQRLRTFTVNALGHAFHVRVDCAATVDQLQQVVAEQQHITRLFALHLEDGTRVTDNPDAPLPEESCLALIIQGPCGRYAGEYFGPCMCPGCHGQRPHGAYGIRGWTCRLAVRPDGSFDMTLGLLLQGSKSSGGANVEMVGEWTVQTESSMRAAGVEAPTPFALVDVSKEDMFRVQFRVTQAVPPVVHAIGMSTPEEFVLTFVQIQGEYAIVSQPPFIVASGAVFDFHRDVRPLCSYTEQSATMRYLGPCGD